MDPLSIATAVVASLQVACSVLSCCYSVRNEMRRIPGTLIQIIEEVRELRNLIETVEPLLNRNGYSDNTQLNQTGTSERLSDGIKPVITSCLAELRRLESRIRPEHVDAVLESKRKALLQTLVWRLKTNEANESITSLQRCKTALNLAISSHNSLVIGNIEKISMSLDNKMNLSCQRIDILAEDFTTARLDESQKAVVDWLSPLLPGRSHLLAKTAHQSGTSEWFLRSEDFQEWLNERSTILWLSGPPGYGKTVMMGHAIESVACQRSDSDDEAVYAFVYCDFRDPESQNITNILGTVLSQICTQLKYFPEELLATYHSSTERGHGNPPPIEAICELIETLSTKRRIYLFIDGIDEVVNCSLLAERLVSLTQSAAHISILATSRNEVAIQRVFEDVRRVSLENHIVEIDEDIEQYILNRLTGDQDLAWLSPEIQSLIAKSLLSKSKGTFQWASCQLDSLSHCRTIRDIKKSLEKLPQGLNETYGRLLARSAPSDVPLVKKIMTWLSFSSIPITLHQLWEALSIEKGKRCIDDEARLRSPQDILLLGNSLLTVSSGGNVMLAHLSVRDYLLSPEIEQDPQTKRFALDPRTSHMELARDCLTYLLMVDLSSGPSNTQVEYLLRLRQLPLLQYATKYWFYHARNAEHSDELQHLTLEFFSPEAYKNFMSWVQVFNADSPFKWSIYPKHATSLYYAASLGLDQVVGVLLQLITQDEVNAPGSRFGGTAIHAATIRGHLTIIQRLIAAGADPGKPDFNQVTPLHSAASQGSMETIRVLLGNGASKEVRDGMDGRTPADWARLSGHLAAAKVIEEYSKSPDQGQDSQVSIWRDETNQSPQEAESQKVELWQPKAGYFPDHYERRSGIDSSLIISLTVGGDTSCYNSDFIPVQTEGQADESNPVW